MKAYTPTIVQHTMSRWYLQQPDGESPSWTVCKAAGSHTNTVEAEFSVFRSWMATYRRASKDSLYLYCGPYSFLRNMIEEYRVKRAAAMAFSSLTDREKEQSNINFNMSCRAILTEYERGISKSFTADFLGYVDRFRCNLSYDFS